MMSVTGEPDGEPVRARHRRWPTSGAGMWALIGILAALHARDASGHGQLVDVSLLDGQVAWLTLRGGSVLRHRRDARPARQRAREPGPLPGVPDRR